MFQLGSALELYPADNVLAYLAKYRRENPYWPEEEEYIGFIEWVKRRSFFNMENVSRLNFIEERSQSKRSTVAVQRNLCQTEYLNEMFEYLKNGDDQELRILMAETFGWYLYSAHRSQIIASCKQQLSMEKDEAVKSELVKTVNRLSIDF